MTKCGYRFSSAHTFQRALNKGSRDLKWIATGRGKPLGFSKNILITHSSGKIIPNFLTHGDTSEMIN